MPVPQPHSGESEQDFVSRCMANDAMQEYDDDQRAAICYSTFRERSPSTSEDRTMAFREKLHELRRKRAELRTKLEPFIKADEDRPNGEPMGDEDKSAFEAIMAELKELEDRIDRCERALAASVPKGDGDNGDDDDDKPRDDDDDEDKRYRGPGLSGQIGIRNLPAYPRARATPQKGPGFRAARFMIGLVHAKWSGAEKAGEFIENRFHDTEVAKYFVNKALNYSVVAEGGALIPQDFMAEMIELLRANVVVRGAGPMTVQMPMGNITIPRLAGGSTAVYQGELDDISVTEEQFDDLNLTAKKLTAMVPVSNDLIRRAPIGVEVDRPR